MSYRLPSLRSSRRFGADLGRRLFVESLETRRLLAIVVHVATDGDDVTGDGTENAPFQTIGKGILEADPDGTVIISAGDYNEAVNVNKTLTLTAAGAVTVNSLANLAANTATLNGSLTADTNFTFNGPVRIATSTQLTAPNVLFNNTVNAVNGLPAPALTVSAGVLARFGNDVTDLVGVVDPLASLTVNGAGAAQIGAAQIKANGNTTTFNTPVTLTANLIITESGAGDVIFASTVVSDATARTLEVNTVGGGTTRFGGNIGAGSALASLIKNAPGLTLIQGAQVRTVGDQTYGDDVQLSQNIEFTGTNIDFQGDVERGAAAVSLLVNTANVGTTRFGGNVGTDANRLLSVTTNPDGKTVLNGIIRTTGNQTYNDDVRIESNTTTIGATISFLEDIDSLNAGSLAGLTIEAAVDANIGDNLATDLVGAPNPLSALAIGAGNDIRLRVPSIQTKGNSVTYNSPLVLVADLTITELGAGDVTFNSTVDSDATPRALTVITLGGGDTVFNDRVGFASHLSRLTTDAPNAPDGTTVINTDRIHTEGASLTFNDPVVLTDDVQITEFGLGPVTFNSTINSDATRRSLEVITPAGAATAFNGDIGVSSRLSALITRPLGTTFIGASRINTDGATIIFDDPVVLTTNVIIDEIGAGDVRFNSTLNSDGTPRNLEVGTGVGNTFFGGGVGVGSRLNNLTTDVDGTTTVAGGDVRTVQTQRYFDPVIVTVAPNTVFDGGSVQFANTLDANANGLNVIVNSAGLTRFGGAVGTLPTLINDLTTNPGGTTEVGGNQVHTAGTQLFRDSVTVTESVVFQGANVRFEQTLDSVPNGDNDVTVLSPGQTLFGGAVGGGVRDLRNLSTDAPGNTDINGVTVTTTETQTYNDRVRFLSGTGTTTLTGGSVRFHNILNAGAAVQSLDIVSPGLTLFGNDSSDLVGGLQPPFDLRTDLPGTTRITAATVTTTRDQIFMDPVLVASDVTTLSNNGNVFFNQTVDGFDDGDKDTFFSLTVVRLNGTNDVIFNGNVGGPAPATGDPADLRFVAVQSNGPLRLVADITVLEDIAINIIEGAAASLTDDLTLEAAAALSAGQDITLNVGDDITFQADSSAVAGGNLTVAGDVGSNDANQGSTISALGASGLISAAGVVQFRGGPDNDFFNIQLVRLQPGDDINFDGAGNGAGNFTLVTDTASVDSNCDPVIAPATATNLPLGDSLNLFDIDQAIGHTYTLDSLQLAREDGLVVKFAEVQQFELNAGAGDDLLTAIMPGLPSVVQFNGGDLDDDQLNIIGSAAADRITVDAITDVSPHRPFEIAKVERLSVRAGDGNDIVVNRVAIPSLLEGQGGDDILAGNSATDVIFGGGGIDMLIGGDGNDFLFPDHDYNGTLQGIAVPANGDVSAGGNGRDGAAPIGSLDAVCSIEDLVDGGAKKDVITWLKARLVSDIEELMGDAFTALRAVGFVIDPPAAAVQAQAPIVNPSFEHWLDNLYQALLGRDFGPTELAYYDNASAGGASKEAIAQGFLNSPERRANIIDGWYQRYLGRSLDAGGRAYWLGVWGQQDAETVEAAILGSGEYFQLVGGTNQAWVEALYTQVLGRTGSNAEMQFWVAGAATTPRAVIAKQFVTSDEYRLYAVARWYQNYLQRAPEAGGSQFWLNRLKNGVKAESIQASILASLEFQQMVW